MIAIHTKEQLNNAKSLVSSITENKRFCEVVKNSLKIYTLARKLAREENERKIEQGKIKLCELSEQLEDILSKNYQN